jgi:selenocysteine lyase/cysteine desulfurase
LKTGNDDTDSRLKINVIVLETTAPPLYNMIQQLRDDTPGCQSRIHFNNAGSSLSPRPVLQAIQQHLELEANIGGYEAADQKQEELNGFYVSLAQLLHAKPHNIAFAFNSTDAYNRALSAVDWKANDVILTTENDYVSNQIAFLALQKRFGVQVVRARESVQGGADLEDFEQLLKKHQPKLAAVTHVPTNSGLVQDVEAIGAMCRQQDVLYLVDACQSAGQMPLDVQRIGCDFLTATMRKYLRGPRGAGFLFASDRVIERGLEMMTPDMRGANWTGANSYESAPSALRFEYWETPPALILGSKAAAEYALNLGLEWIEARVTQVSQLTRKLLTEIPGVQVLDRGTKLAGIITAHSERWEPKRLMTSLQQENINCRISTRGVAQIDFHKKGVEWALRISPHYYNTEFEIRQLMDVLEHSSKGGS